MPISNRCILGLMPNFIKKSWTLSTHCMAVLNLNCAKDMSKLCHLCIQDVGLTRCIRNYVTKIQNRILELH